MDQAKLNKIFFFVKLETYSIFISILIEIVIYFTGTNRKLVRMLSMDLLELKKKIFSEIKSTDKRNDEALSSYRNDFNKKTQKLTKLMLIPNLISSTLLVFILTELLIRIRTENTFELPFNIPSFLHPLLAIGLVDAKKNEVSFITVFFVLIITTRKIIGKFFPKVYVPDFTDLRMVNESSSF